MRGRADPAWRRYYEVSDRAHLVYGERRITRQRLRAIIEAARLRAYREQEARPVRRAS